MEEAKLEESRPKYVTHELEGIGEIRTHSGTALSTIAGGMKYWYDKAIEAQEALSNVVGNSLDVIRHERSKSRAEGAFTATITIFTLETIALVVYHYIRK